MSIDGINTNPTDPDRVTMYDPGTDSQTEPSPGTDTLPTADTITHLRRAGRSRDWRDNPAYDPARHEGRDPDSAFSGTDGEPERVQHDEALQVRQLLPTRWDVTPFPVVSGVNPVNLLPPKVERMGLVVYNIGPAVAYIGPLPTKALPTTGFPLAAGASLVVDALDSVWATIDTNTGALADIRIVETWRTDNKGN